MIIKVKGYLTYRDIIGYREIMRRDDIPITFLEFLREFAAEIGGEHGCALFDEQTNSVGRSVAIMLNGLHYNQLPNKLNTVLQDQDEIALFPPGAGG
jgi:molybdopterin converting factor small subunit